MAKVYAFLAEGLEEVECLAVVDVLRRSGVEVTMVSVSGRKEVTGSHGIRLMADALFEEADPDQADVLFLPGGMPGTNNLREHQGLREAIERANKQGRSVCFSITKHTDIIWFFLYDKRFVTILTSLGKLPSPKK